MRCLQHEQNSIEAKKGIVAFPSEQQRRDGDNAFTFEEGEVYGLNILVTNGEKIVRPFPPPVSYSLSDLSLSSSSSPPSPPCLPAPAFLRSQQPKADEARTTIYQKTTSTYLLKMKTSRATFSEISKKAGSFPFTLRTLEEESKARMGVRECVQHGLLKPFEVQCVFLPSSSPEPSLNAFRWEQDHRSLYRPFRPGLPHLWRHQDWRRSSLGRPDVLLRGARQERGRAQG